MKSLKSLSSFSVLFAIGIGAVILIFPQAALDGVRSGAELCMNVVVPSLFPFMVVSIFVSGFALPKRISGAVSAVMRLLFRLPGDAVYAIVSGLAGGYPVGCAVTARLYSQGKVTREQAQRMTLFCINSGPAFAVTAVGSVMLGSVRAGVIIYASLCISALLIGIVLRFFAPVPITDENRAISDVPLSDRFVEATEKAAVSMLKICAWITLFSCFFSLINEFGFDKNVVTAIRCLLEATGGCRAVSEYGNIYCVTATLGWSGLCVICQVLGDIRKVGTPFALFVSFRAVHAALSAVVCHLLLTAFPLEASVFAPFAAYTAVEFFSASAPATLALLGLCTVFIIDLDRNKKIC